MRLSRYNFVTTSDSGELLLFNPWRCAMVGLEPDFYRRYLDPGHGDPHLAPPQAQADFLRGHFTVPDGVDELEEYKFERARESLATDRLDLIVAPTLDCNLACVYCYEQVRRPGAMGPATVRALQDMVSQRLKAAAAFFVTWYGGEPLLALDLMEELGGWFAAQARARDVPYHARVLTNGLLLTPRVARGLVDLGVASVQVSLDGPAELHDRRRPRVGGQGTFRTILENLRSAPPELHMAIRVAVDGDNRDRAWELYEELLELGLAGRCQVLVRPVCDSPGVCRSAAASCMSPPDFYAWYFSGLRRRLEAGRPTAGLDHLYPRPGFGCMGTQLSQVMVDPQGLMQRCLEEVGLEDRSTGSVDQPLAFGPVLQQWMSLDPTALPGCRDCRLLPLCGGGCPGRLIREGAPQCSPYLVVLEEALRVHDRCLASKAGGIASGEESPWPGPLR